MFNCYKLEKGGVDLWHVVERKEKAAVRNANAKSFKSVIS